MDLDVRKRLKDMVPQNAWKSLKDTSKAANECIAYTFATFVLLKEVKQASTAHAKTQLVMEAKEVFQERAVTIDPVFEEQFQNVLNIDDGASAKRARTKAEASSEAKPEPC